MSPSDPVWVKTGPECDVTWTLFAIPKDPGLYHFSLGSLWILGDLDSSCVLKQSLLKSEYSDLLFGCQKSPYGLQTKSILWLILVVFRIGLGPNWV